MFMETYTADFIYLDRSLIENANRDQLQLWLEARGTAVYDDEPTALLRECLMADYESGMML